MIDELAKQIWDREEFQKDYGMLLGLSLKKSLKLESIDISNIEKRLIRLLQAATHFSFSSKHKYKDAAYRIAIGSKIIAQEYNLSNVLNLIFSRLGNFPAINFLSKNNPLDLDIPERLWLEIKSHELENTVHTSLGDTLVLTDFQRKLWKGLVNRNSSSLSAPTSSGKSFALQNYLASKLAESDSLFGLYLVPTRALINQVSLDLIQLFKKGSKDEVLISTVPVPPDELGMKRGIYVLTQERLQVLSESEKKPRFDIVVVDEAQSVGDGSRGIILQTVIDNLRKENHEIQLIFGCPNTDNINIFSTLFDIENLNEIKEFESPVAQNLIFVDCDSIDLRKIHLKARFGDKELKIGIQNASLDLIDNKQKLSYLSWFFGRFEKNLVYAGSPAACEDVAYMIADLVGGEFKITEEIEDLSKFLKDHVHPKYILSELVKSGVAFHYGDMPTIVRKTIEEYFQEGRLNFLVCTSTLLQGVNLPAKNLFLLDPSKGGEWLSKRDIPISPIEFWNLAGRAGRLGKDFEGNVFLIDHSKWRNDPMTGAKTYQIESSYYNMLSKNSENLIDFINNPDHPSGTEQEIESAFVRIYNEFKKGELEHTFAKVFKGSNKDLELKIIEGLKNIKVTVPDKIVEQHISISVFRQEAMYQYFLKRIKEKGPKRVIPLHPLQGWDDSLGSLRLMFKRIHTYFQKLPSKDNSHNYFAPLGLRWMRGESLPRLINDAFEYAKTKRQKGDPGLSTVIRKVINDLEQEIRFRYVKYTSCYIDLLEEALKATNHEDEIASIPSIPLYLELGASSQTMISLIGLGLSRTAAASVTDLAVNKGMNAKETLGWLKKRSWENTDISRIILKEIRRIIE